MIILHYALGFPPYRTGGLTKFCMDLMKQQIDEGHRVMLLWPGEIRLIWGKIRIKKHKNVGNIGNYEIINPIPVPFDEGIKDFDSYEFFGDVSVYDFFINQVKPDVIHVHTLMGLHKSFLDAANRNAIRIVFSTHDFFPICPKVTMFRRGQVCSCITSCEECGVCNNTALSLGKIQILQSPIYRELKDSQLVRKLRKQHRDAYLSDVSQKDFSKSVGTADDYKKLREHYGDMLLMMDVIHYNSTVTQAVYESIFKITNSRLINITHADIVDRRKIKKFSNIIRIRYLGPQANNKGYYVLKNVLDELWNERQDFTLDVHFVPISLSPYIKSHGRYTYDELEKIFDETDVLIAPSLWYETYGFTVLEALSYGVPVIISGNVGAKDILADGAGIVIEDFNEIALLQALRSINTVKLEMMNKIIVENQSIITIQEMSNKIQRECYVGG